MNQKQISIPITEYSIQADWYEGTSNDNVLLTFVGFGSSKKNDSEFVANVVKQTGMSALVLDFSGHGESTFDINNTMPAQHLIEATKAYDWLAESYPERTINVMGTSYGGFMTAYLTRFRDIAKLVLRTPAIYEPKDFYTIHQHIDKLAVRGYRKDTETLKKHPLFLQEAVSRPNTLLVVHGNDESIPIETSEVYRDAFNAEMYVAEGFVHAFRDPSNPQDQIEGYYQAVTRWLISE